MTTTTTTTKVSPRTVWAALLGVIGLFTLAIGIALLFGGAWTAVTIGAVLLAYSMILALPNKTMWG